VKNRISPTIKAIRIIEELIGDTHSNQEIRMAVVTANTG
jgi:hypothetical protein